MVGRGRPRKRAPSVSTVATLDDTSIRYLRESTVLKPVSARDHPDDWPCFLLTDATVYHRTGSLANLLHVDLEGPFIVRGRLEVEKDQERYLVNRPGKSKSPWLQIQSSTSFSIGQKEDQGLPIPVLWASGESGWFEIIPSDRYRAVGEVMFQGINLHYNILDQYEDALAKLQRKKGNRSKTLEHVGLSLDEVLFHYAVAVGDGITLPEARQRCAEQAVFLLSHFPKESSFYRWLADQFPDIVNKLAQKHTVIAQKVAESTHPMLRAASSSLEVSDRLSKDHSSARASIQRITRNSEAARGESIETSIDGQHNSNSKATRLRGSPTDTKFGTADVEMLDASDTMPSSSKMGGENHGLPVLLSVLEDIRLSILNEIQGGKNKKHPNQMMPNTWHYRVYLACRIKHRLGGSEVCQYFARDLVRVLDADWRETEFYKWAKAHANERPNFEYSSESECLNLSRRNSRQPKATTGQAGPSSRPSKQPAPEPAGKQPPRKRGRPSGKAAGLRPSLGGKKRLRLDEEDEEDGEMDTDDRESKKTAKKSRYFSDDNEPEDDDEAASSAAEEDEEEEAKGGPLARLVIRAERLPRTMPRGPNQTWTCEEPNCGYVVRAADGENGQNLISTHYEEHEKEARDEAQEAALKKVNLAVQESGGNMPINHLLEKIRTMGQKTQRRNEGRVNGQALPQPIKRTLLI